MRAIDVHIHRREFIDEAFRDKTLRRQMIAFVKLGVRKNIEDTWVTFKGYRMKRYLVTQMRDSGESLCRILKRNTPDQAVHFDSE